MKPLEGIRVVDLSTMLAGPMTGRILAEWGADVIKVETMNGDAWRIWVVKSIWSSCRYKRICPYGNLALA